MDNTTLQTRRDALREEITRFSQDAQAKINAEQQTIQARQQNLTKIVRDSQRQIDNLEGRLNEVESLLASTVPTVGSPSGLAGEVKDGELVGETPA